MTDKLFPFDLKDVTLTDVSMKQGQQLVLEFIKKMEPDRILCPFRRNAGVSDLGYEPYGGWENSLIGGHALGHYFSAAAMAVNCFGDKVLEERLEYIVSSLREVQRYYGNGFLSGATCEEKERAEELFDIEEGKKTGATWVPWYALHKVLQGILDIYIYTENATALEVATDLGKWVCRRTFSWSDDLRNRILATEYGGINDTLYQLYEITKDDDFARAYAIFCDEKLYQILSSKEETLAGIHANTTIPKFIGALHEKKYFEMVKNFYWRVVNHQTYPTGAVGDMEHFIKEDALEASRSQCNGESCCTYNMMKLSQKLFCATKEFDYLDYYERAILNARMGSVNALGGTTYFNPMGTGFFKYFGSHEPKDNLFWCCTGTGMEDFMKLGDGIYFHNDNHLYVTQYFASTLNWGEKNIKVTMKADLKNSDEAVLSLVSKKNQEISLSFRRPKWSGEFLVNGEEKTEFSVKLRSGEKLNFKISLKKELQTLTLLDCSDVFGFAYGPFVLAAKLPTEKKKEIREAGIDVYAPKWKYIFSGGVKPDIEYAKTFRAVLKEEYLTLPDDIKKEDVAGNPSAILKNHCTGKKIEFSFGELDFVPYDEIKEERYGIYWYFI